MTDDSLPKAGVTDGLNTLPATRVAPNAFDGEYFTEQSVYARFDDALHAAQAIARWYAALLRLVVRTVGPLAMRDVLDAGCGYGAVPLALDRLGARVTGVDVSRFVIERNRAVLPDLRFDIIDLQTRDALPQESYDVITCFEVVEHLADFRLAINNMARALRPNGYLVLTTPNRGNRVPFYRWDTDPTHISVRRLRDWQNTIESVGLQVEQSSTFLTLPLVWRYGPAFSRLMTLGSFGPTSLLIARKSVQPEASGARKGENGSRYS